MHVKEFQDLIRELYLKRDQARGLDKTFLWLVEEMGELSEAIRKNDLANVEEELADVMAWATSVANLYGFELEDVLQKKYGKLCHYCRANPCACTKA